MVLGQKPTVSVSSSLRIFDGLVRQVGVAPTGTVCHTSMARFVQSAAECSWIRTVAPLTGRPANRLTSNVAYTLDTWVGTNPGPEHEFPAIGRARWR